MERDGQRTYSNKTQLLGMSICILRSTTHTQYSRQCKNVLSSDLRIVKLVLSLLGLGQNLIGAKNRNLTSRLPTLREPLGTELSTIVINTLHGLFARLLGKTTWPYDTAHGCRAIGTFACLSTADIARIKEFLACFWERMILSDELIKIKIRCVSANS